MKKTIFIFVLPIFILISLGLIYNYLLPDEKRIEIKELSGINIYTFNSYTKFSNNQVGGIYNEEKTSKLKTLLNSLDTQNGIEKITYPEDIKVESFKYAAHIRPVFKFIDDNHILQDGTFLLHIFIENSKGNSYIVFSGSEVSYILDKTNTNILKEVFSSQFSIKKHT